MATKQELLELSRHFNRISNAPLKDQDSSDAWNERQNRLAAARDSAKLQIRSALTPNAQTEVLPEDIASVMTAPQAYDKVKGLLAQQTKAERGTITSEGSSRRHLPGINSQLLTARKELSEAMGRHRGEISQYGKQDTLSDDLGRSTETFGANLLSQTMGLPGDFKMDSVIGALDRWAGSKPRTQPLRNSEEFAKQLGGDPDHPSWITAALLAPGPGEIKGGIKAVTAAIKAAPDLLSKGPEGLQWAMTLFHGTSAKRLEGDNFNLDFIGQGEGEQVRGHGIYFAERQGIGKHYQNALGGNDIKTTFLNALPENADFDELAGSMDSFSPDQQQFLKALEADDWFGFDYPSQAIEAALRTPERFDASPALMKAREEVTGSLFKTDIPDEVVADFVDLDGQMFKQPKKVQDAFRASGLYTDDMNGMTGEQAYRVLAMRLAVKGGIQVNKTIPETMSKADLMRGEPGDWFRMSNRSKKELQKAASEFLMENGIDGMKFRDAGSRITTGGGFLRPLLEKRTNNLVVFNPEKITRIENADTGEIIRNIK